MTRALTAKGAATRQRIVDGAAKLVRDRGVRQVSLDDIRAATSTSQSQLFHYFPDGRAELLQAVASHEAAQVIADQQPYLDQLGTARSWRAWRDIVVRKYREQGIRCPLSALNSQLDPADSDIRDIISGLLLDWHRRIADGIRRSQQSGVIDASLRPDPAAATILAAIQGGVGIFLATADITFLETALDAALASLNLRRTTSAR
jgi:AcrR family transcriptional regulator